MALADALAEYKNGGKARGVSFRGIIETYVFHRGEFAPFHARIERNTSHGFHPSGMAEACPRALAFQFLHEVGKLKKDFTESVGETRFKSARMEMLFDFGHIIHMLLQYGYLPNISKLKFKAEVPVRGLMKKYLISGTADIVVTLQDGLEYVVDVKTMRSEIFARTKSIEDLSPEYLTQLNLYMEGLGIPRGLFLLVNKNDSDMREIFVNRSPSIVQGALRLAEKAKTFIEGGEHPPVLQECRAREGKYKHCDFTALCFACTDKKTIARFCK
jgi:hypothetical protein